MRMNRFCMVYTIILINMISCAEDPCAQLCVQTAQELNSCLQEWPANWNDIGSTSRQDFSDSCRNLWAAERSTLEPRALDDAYEQCEESIVYLSNDAQQCDQLRAIYLLPIDY